MKKNNILKYSFLSILILFLFSLLYISYIKTERDSLKNQIEVSTTIVDTFYIENTIVDSIPYPIYKNTIKYLTDTLITTDTIPKLVEVIIPIDSIVYQKQIVQNMDTITYSAYVSGYKSSLDSIKFNIKYPYIKETTYIPIKENRISFSIQSGVGYGIINNKPDVFIGVGISYKLK